MYLILTPHASHGRPLADLLGGPGLVSIPALIRRIRREWAGFVPPIGQKTTWVWLVAGGVILWNQADDVQVAGAQQLELLGPHG